MQNRQQTTNGDNLQFAHSNCNANGPSTSHAGSNGNATTEMPVNKIQRSSQLPNGSLSCVQPGPALHVGNDSQLEGSQATGHEVDRDISMQTSWSEQIARATKPSALPQGQGEPWLWKLDEDERHKRVLSMMGVAQPESDAIAGIFSTRFTSLKTECRLGLQQIFKKVCDTTTSDKATNYIHKI